MTHTYDSKTQRHTVSHGNIAVHGPTESGCEQRVLDLLARFKHLEDDAERDRLFRNSVAAEY